MPRSQSSLQGPRSFVSWMQARTLAALAAPGAELVVPACAGAFADEVRRPPQATMNVNARASVPMRTPALYVISGWRPSPPSLRGRDELERRLCAVCADADLARDLGALRQLVHRVDDARVRLAASTRQGRAHVLEEPIELGRVVRRRVASTRLRRELTQDLHRVGLDLLVTLCRRSKADGEDGDLCRLRRAMASLALRRVG